MPRNRKLLIWGLLTLALAVPVILSLQSPLLAYRRPVYIAAGLAGIFGLALLLIQPLLARGALPGLFGTRARSLHRLTGGLLLVAVLVHVALLWITSPPDVIDVLLVRSPTPFSIWGLLAFWAVVATALIAAFRRGLAPGAWRIVHRALAAVIVTGTILHALLIEGTMEPVTKALLCALVAAASLWAVFSRRPWRGG